MKQEAGENGWPWVGDSGSNFLRTPWWFPNALHILFLVPFLSACFSFAWGADRGPINSGETKIGLSITAPSYLDTWTFHGNTGDRAVINAVTTSGSLDTRIVVYPPGGGAAEAASY